MEIRAHRAPRPIMERTMLTVILEELIMNRTSIVALALLSLPLLAGGCARRGAADPVGRSTTTGAVVCPEGYVTSTDGRVCVVPAPPPGESYNFQVP